MPARELREAGSQASMRSHPGDDLVEWGPNAAELAGDHLVQRELATEACFVLVVDLVVPELD
jgi:hypothetical protein